jgi:protein-disulfide isomerase
LASRKQGKYVEFHKGLMLASGLVNESKVLEVAAEVGLDVDLLKQEMEASEISEVIERNRELAKALRITGTPSFVIGDQMLRGAADAEAIGRVIRAAREAREK